MEKIQLQREHPFVVMAKPVGSRCNLACSYCYYLDTPVRQQESQAPCMSDETLETYIRQYIEASPGPAVSFTWHGGEPTLAGLPFFRRAVELQKQYLPRGWSCWNNLQTNGLLLDEAWCAFLAEEGFDVGLSLDGSKWIHDKYRKNRGGEGSYDRCVEAVRRLQRHGVQPDLLCTVTADAAKEPAAVYRALRNLDTGWIQFIPIVNTAPGGGVTPESVDGAAYGKFLCDILDLWMLNDLGRLEVQLFAETAMVLAGGSASLCWMAPRCGQVLVVEQGGGVYACDHFVDAAHQIGNIRNGHLAELCALPEQLAFGDAKADTLPRQCRECDCLLLCNGGCPKDRIGFSAAGEPGLNHLCGGLKQFFHYAAQPLRKITALRGQRLAPDAIMSSLREDVRTRWAGVGRNDPCPCGSGRKAKQCCWEKRP